MGRELVWIDKPRFEGWGCSACAWLFHPSGPPTGESLEDMKEEFERHRDTAFASHMCAEHPRTKTRPTPS